METIIRVQNWVEGNDDVKEHNQFYWLSKLKKNLIKVGLAEVVQEAERDFFESDLSPVMTYVQLIGKYGIYTIGSERFFPLSSCLRWSLVVCNETLFEYYWTKTCDYRESKIRLISFDKDAIIRMCGGNPFFAYLFFSHSRWFNDQEKKEFFQQEDKTLFIVQKLLTSEAFYYECYKDIQDFVNYAQYYKFEEIVYFDGLQLIDKEIKRNIAKQLLKGRSFKQLLSGVFDGLCLKTPSEILSEKPIIIDTLFDRRVLK